ncbi:MAG: SusE domain-containing protein [Lewinellaceae bacterium]|nr:SusE domain-containing protein [Lewinellaceae bacterium]
MIKKIILYSALVALVATSCTDPEFGPVLQDGVAATIQAPTGNASFVLKEADKAKIFSTFTWTAADFGFAAGVTYAVELDLKKNNFSDPTALAQVNALSYTATIGKINDVLLAKGAPGEAEIEVQVRIVASINPDVDKVYSDPITLKVTPYTAFINYPKVYVPGSYQGWKPEDTTTVLYSVKSDGRYEGYIYFPEASMFKITPEPNWNSDWGLSGEAGKLAVKGSDIPTDAGYFRINFNANTLAFSTTKTDWGVIGDATPTGWDSDTDMIYNPTTRTLSVTMNLVPGKIKFRANNDWAINLGDDDANRSLEYGGADIAIAEAGNYTIELILNVAVYTYKITKN